MKLTSKKVELEMKGGVISVPSAGTNWESTISSNVRINKHYTEFEGDESYESIVQDKHAFVTEWTVLGKTSIQKAFNNGSKDEFIVEW